MKTSQEFLDEVAKENGYEDFLHVAYAASKPSTLLNVTTEAMKRFAAQALDEAAEEAYCDEVHPPDDEYPELEESEVLVIKSSILNIKKKLV